MLSFEASGFSYIISPILYTARKFERKKDV